MPADPQDPTQITGPDVGERVPQWDIVTDLAWRPAWSIRSRRGSLAPFVDLMGEWMRAFRRQDP